MTHMAAKKNLAILATFMGWPVPMHLKGVSGGPRKVAKEKRLATLAMFPNFLIHPAAGPRVFPPGDFPMRFRSLSAAVFFVLAAQGAARAQTALPTVAELGAKVQAKYEKVSDLSAKFEQDSTIPGSRKKRKAQGSVKFKKPGMMRWDYKTPYEQAFVSDGKKFYYYNAQEKFYAVKKLAEAFGSPTPNDFLQGLGRLDQAFKLSAPSEGLIDSEGRYRLVLSPKEADPQGYSLTLLLAPTTFDVVGVAFADAMGSQTIVRFLEMKENKGISDSVFSFTPPAGVTERQEF